MYGSGSAATPAPPNSSERGCACDTEHADLVAREILASAFAPVEGEDLVDAIELGGATLRFSISRDG